MIHKNLGHYISDFLTSYMLKAKASRENTIKSYSYTFILFYEYMKSKKHIGANKIMVDDFNLENVTGFLRWLHGVRGNVNSTINQRHAAISSFAEYLPYKCPEYSSACISISAIPIMNTEEKTPVYLTLNGVRLLLKQPDIKTYMGVRDKCLLLTMFETAARVQEIIDLTPSSIRFTGEISVIILHGKGNKTFPVPVSQEVSNLMKEYLKAFGLDKREKLLHPLFPNKQGNKMSRNAINNILLKHSKTAKAENPLQIPDGISCHALRHSKAMALLERGVDLIHIRDFLRHKSIQTTEIYARANPHFVFDAVKKAYENLTNEEPKWKALPDVLDFLKKLTR